MPLIVYPSVLPPPLHPLSVVPRERRALPPEGAAFEPRGRQRDFAGAAYEATWVYSPDEMEVWRLWYQDDLLYGLRRFSAMLPLHGGHSSRVVRYIGEQRREHLGRGIYRISSQLEVRGASEAPRIVVYQFLDRFNGDGLIEAHTPDVAPAGFAYSIGTHGLVLLGNGTAKSASSIGDGRALSDASDPELSLALTSPYTMRLVGTASEPGGSPEQIAFRLSDSIERGLQIGLITSLDVDDTHRVRVVTGPLDAPSQDLYYAIDGVGPHTLDVTFNDETDTVTIMVDGATIAEPAVSASSIPTVATRITLECSQEPSGVFGVIDEVAVLPAGEA